jgi:hypothetical protein
MTGWMNSSGHRANLLDTDVHEIGIGYFHQPGDQGNVRRDTGNCTAGGANGPYRHYWTQDFGRRVNVFPLVIEREAYETTTREVDLYVYGSGFATEMRFRNEGSPWSPWEPHRSTKTWTLSPGSGTKTVWVELRGGGNTCSFEDTIVLAQDATGVPWEDARLVTFRMEPAFPNPFRGRTRLSLELVTEGVVDVQVFDVRGRQVATLLSGARPAGRHDVEWDGRDAAGRHVGRGVYWIRVRTGREAAAQRVVLE